MATLPTLAQLVAALGISEGANVPGTIPNTTGNITDLEMGDVGYGTVSAAEGQQITSFGGDSALGTSEALNVINTELYNEEHGLSPQLTLGQYLNQWGTGNVNTPSTLSTNVPQILGVPASTPLTSFGQVASQAQGVNLGDEASMLNPLTYLQNPLSNPMVQKLQQQNAPQWLKSVEDFITSETGSWVAIGVGLVLIAGAVFGFKNIGTTIYTGAKEGAKAAGVAAAVAA